MDRFNVPLELQVEQFLAQMTHVAPADLPRDKDGDLYGHNDTAVVFVRIISDPVAVVVFSPAVVDVCPSPTCSCTWLHCRAPAPRTGATRAAPSPPRWCCWPSRSSATTSAPP